MMEYFDLSGVLVFDPCIGQFGYTQEVFAVPFVETNADLHGRDSGTTSIL